MENELECLGDRKGHDGHLAKKVLKKILFLARVIFRPTFPTCMFLE